MHTNQLAPRGREKKKKIYVADCIGRGEAGKGGVWLAVHQHKISAVGQSQTYVCSRDYIDGHYSKTFWAKQVRQ